MNQELKRIKSKDFSQIDEKLYEDLSRADNLTSTLSQLSDFQKFLMEQITNLNQNPQNNTSRLIANSIAKNFDHLKESLVKCSRIKEKCDMSKIATLKDQLASLRQDLKQAKNAINKQAKQAGFKNNEIVGAFMQDILAKMARQKKKNDQFVLKYQSILNQNQQLKLENQKLKRSRTLENKLEFQIIPPKIFTQSNALKSKGVNFQEIKRGKSKQKIKLFSMI